MNHDIDWHVAPRLEAVFPPHTIWTMMPASTRFSLDDHFPWHRIRRMSRK